MVQGVGLALPGVPKDGDHLEELIRPAPQSAHKVLLILHLSIHTGSAPSPPHHITIMSCHLKTENTLSYLHLLSLVHQKEAAHLLQLGLQDLHLGLPGSQAVILGCSRRWVRCQRVLPLVDAAVGALLAVQTQVDLTALAAHHRSEASPVDGAAAVPLARVAEGNVARCDPNPVVVPHPLLAVELQLAAGALQAAAFIALERGLV